MFDIAEHISLSRIPKWIQQGKLGSTTNRGNDLTFIFDLERLEDTQALWVSANPLEHGQKSE